MAALSRRMRICWLAVLTIFGAALQVQSAQVIASARVIADEPDRGEEVLALLDIEVGKELDRAILRQRIRAMYASGEVDTLRVETAETERGLAVVVRVGYAPIVEKISIEASAAWRRRIRSWFDVREGAKVSTGHIEAGVRRVERRIRERGYSEATIDPDLRFFRSNNTVQLVLTLNLGPPLRVRRVTAVDVQTDDPLDFVSADYKVGSILTNRFAERLRDEIEVELRNQGYWEAIALGTERVETQNGIDLHVRVDPGARYRLELQCSEEVEELVRAAVPDPAEQSLHPAQTTVIAETIRERLQVEGLLLPQVDVELITGDEERTLNIRVEPGQKYRIEEVVFDGAASVPARELEKVIRVRSGKVGGWRGQKVSSTTLERDRLALVSSYQAKGFADALVENPRIELVEADRVAVVFRIHEGLRWRLDEVQYFDFPVEVVSAVEEIDQDLGRTEPWYEGKIEKARQKLEVALANAGYPDGRVTADTVTLGVGVMRVSFLADPGQYVRIGEIVIAGLKETRTSLVAGVLERAGVVSGASWSADAMLNAQRELYELGLFRRVEFVTVHGDARRPTRGLVLRCEEGEQRSYLLGIGWDTVNRARFTLGWSHLNLYGGAHAFSTEVRLSNREQRFQASLRESRLPLLGEPGYLVAYRTEEEFPTYSQLRRGVWFEVGDRRRRPFRPWLRYEYQIVTPNADEEILSDLERREQQVQISSLTPTMEWDTRNDLLAPTRGILARFSAEYAFSLLNANAEFLKLTSDFSVHGALSHGIGAASLRLGTIKPLGDLSNDPMNLQIPINSRFFAGGPSTHRAFDIDYLGVPGRTLDDGGDPIGGNALVLVNLEYQRQISGPFAVVVFVDGGNVWSEPAEVEWDDFRWGVGLGLRFDTPAGPLRAEYGYKLDRQEDERRGQFFFSFGIPF